MCGFVKGLKPIDIRLSNKTSNLSHSLIADPPIDRLLAADRVRPLTSNTATFRVRRSRRDAPCRDALKSYKLQANVCNLPRRVVDLAGEQTRMADAEGFLKHPQEAR